MAGATTGPSHDTPRRLIFAAAIDNTPGVRMRGYQDVSDEELDQYVLTRLELLGVDLSVLPEDDSEAPADQTRILASARRFLRSTPAAIHGFEMDVQDVPPEGYPAALRGRTEGS